MFSDTAYVILLKKDKLEIFFQGQSKELVFPQDLVRNLEILDLSNFEKILDQFITELKLKQGKVLIILSDDLVFQKTIPVISDMKTQKDVSDFLAAIPFSSQKVSFKKIATTSQMTIFCTNKDFYHSVRIVLENKGLPAYAVVPFAVFKDNLEMEGENLDAKTIKKMLTKVDLIKTFDFLSDGDEKIKVSIFQKSFSFVYLIILGIIIIAIVTFWGVVTFKLIENPLGPVKIVPKAPTALKESSPSALEESSESAKLKKELKIQISNGSGIAGQASKLKSQLEELGYENIETGNAESKQDKTLVIFSKNISNEDKDEIKNELEKTFAGLEIEYQTTEVGFDVTITTGTDVLEK